MYDDDWYPRGRGRGYDWESGMSRNAVNQYDYGAKPKSRWTKNDMINMMIDYDYPHSLINYAKTMSRDQLALQVLEYDSWHHTSGQYNRTDFYTVKDPENVTINDLYRANSITKQAHAEKNQKLKQIKKQEQGKPQYEIIMASYPYSFYNSYLRKYDTQFYTGIGQRIGKKIYFNNGYTKLVSSCRDIKPIRRATKNNKQDVEKARKKIKDVLAKAKKKNRG